MPTMKEVTRYGLLIVPSPDFKELDFKLITGLIP